MFRRFASSLAGLPEVSIKASMKESAAFLESEISRAGKWTPALK